MSDVIVRTATAADADQIVELNRVHNGEDAVPPVRRLLEDPDVGPSCFTVAVDGSRVVSTLCLLRKVAVFRCHGVEVDVPLGEPEFVVTDPDYRWRRLIRDQIVVVHQWSQQRGELAQSIIGIPYFYRRFGYEYATMPLFDAVVDSRPSSPDGWTVRAATDDDVETIIGLQRAAQRPFDVVVPMDAVHWRHMFSHLDGNLVAVSPSGEAAGYALRKAGGDLWLTAASAPEAVHALTAHAWTPGGIGVRIRPGTLAEGVLVRYERRSVRWGPYIRVPDVRALLARVVPVLEARLARSAFADARGTLHLSFYTHGVAISYDGGRVEVGPGNADATSAFVPPDMLATLVFGGHGASGLEARHPDVNLREERALMDTLFPQLTFDSIYW